MEADVAPEPPSPSEDDTLLLDAVTLEEPVTTDVPFELLPRLPSETLAIVPVDEPPAVTALVVLPLATVDAVELVAVVVVVVVVVVQSLAVLQLEGIFLIVDEVAVSFDTEPLAGE